MPILSVRFRVNFDRDEAVGPGKIALLEHIAQSGSLSQAARDLKMSYRRAWILLESLNGAFLEQVAVTSTGGRGGGGATLTAFGKTLVDTYRVFEEDMQKRAARHFAPIAALARKTPARTASARVRRLSNQRAIPKSPRRTARLPDTSR